MVIQADELATNPVGPSIEIGTLAAGDERMLLKSTAVMAAYPALFVTDYVNNGYVSLTGGQTSSTDNAAQNGIDIFPRDASNEAGIQAYAYGGSDIALYTDGATHVVLVDNQTGDRWQARSRRDTHAVASTTKTTDASGYATVTHGAPATPACVLVQAQAPSGGVAKLPGACIVDQVGATTFRVRFLAHDGSGALANTAVTFRYACLAA